MRILRIWAALNGGLWLVAHPLSPICWQSIWTLSSFSSTLRSPLRVFHWQTWTAFPEPRVSSLQCSWLSMTVMLTFLCFELCLALTWAHWMSFQNLCWKRWAPSMQLQL
jgi:hypothetical protein